MDNRIMEIKESRGRLRGEGENFNSSLLKWE